MGNKKKFLFVLFIFLTFSNIYGQMNPNVTLIDGFDKAKAIKTFRFSHYEKLTSVAIVKLNSDVDSGGVGRIMPTIYIVDKNRRRFLYNKGIFDITSYSGQYDSIIFRFSMPFGICANPLGDIYVTDLKRKSLIKLKNYKGNISFVWEKKDNFMTPTGVCLDENNNVYVVDKGASEIKKFNSDGEKVYSFHGDYILKDIKFSADATIDSTGNIFVCDSGNRRISKFSSSGDYITAINYQDLGYQYPYFTGITRDKFDNIYVSDSQYNVVFKFNNDLHLITKMGSSNPSDDLHFNHPLDVAVNLQTGSLLVLQTNGGKLFQTLPGLNIKTKKDKFFPFSQDREIATFTLTSESIIEAFVENSSGNVVRKLLFQKWYKPSEYVLKWDGRDNLGNYVEAKDYKIIIIANPAVNIPQKTDFNPNIFDILIYNKYFKDGFGQEVQFQLTVSYPDDYLKIEQINPTVITLNEERIILTYSIEEDLSFQIRINPKEYSLSSIPLTPAEPIYTNTISQTKGSDKKYTWTGETLTDTPAKDGVYELSYNAGTGWSENITIGVDRIPIKILEFNAPITFAPKQGTATISFKLNEKAYVSITLLDSKTMGEVFKIINNQEYSDNTLHQITFNGKDENEEYIKEGKYKFKIKAIDITGSSFDEK